MFIMQRDVMSTNLENVAHPTGKKIKPVVPLRLEMPWRATGKSWECGLSNECTDEGEISYKQHKEIDDIRDKYFVKMLLNDANTFRAFVEADVARYKKLTDNQKRRLEVTTFDTITSRLDN
ncbi:hypothetical protein Hanom_Chr15g01382261 [Helianthus anomalus]